MAIYKARADGDPSLCKLAELCSSLSREDGNGIFSLPFSKIPLNGGWPLESNNRLWLYILTNRTLLSSLSPPTILLMNSVSALSRFDVATRNQEAINADIVRQVLQAPSDLRQIFRTGGYDGVVRWAVRFAPAPCTHSFIRFEQLL